MRINTSKRGRKRASVFLIALAMIALFALILSSYLTLVQGQAEAVARSQNYETAIPVAEAGMEEAFSLINKNGGASTWSNNLTADGWSAMSSSNTTTKSNLVFGLNYYLVTISNAPGATPVITSAGVVPYIEHGWGIEMSTNTSISSSVVSLVRTIQVQTTQTPQLGAALAAIGDITFQGNASVDSFNSMNTNLSVHGAYSPTMVDDKATVATDATVVSSIAGGGNVSIRGYVNTGAGGSIAAAGNISIGDNNWVSNATPGIEPSRSNDTFNVTFPDVTTPTATFVESPTWGSVSGTNYSMVFEGNQYLGFQQCDVSDQPLAQWAFESHRDGWRRSHLYSHRRRLRYDRTFSPLRRAGVQCFDLLWRFLGHDWRERDSWGHQCGRRFHLWFAFLHVYFLRGPRGIHRNHLRPGSEFPSRRRFDFYRLADGQLIRFCG